MKRLGLALFLVALASPLAAQSLGGMTVRDYQKVFERNSSGGVADVNAAVYFQAYIEGLGNGLVLSGGLLAVQGREPALCTPKGVRLNFENYKSMIDDQLQEWSKKEPILEDMKVEVALIAALDKAFRCPQTPASRK